MKKNFQHGAASSSSTSRRVELSDHKRDENLSDVQSQGAKHNVSRLPPKRSYRMVSTPITSLPSGSKKGKVAVSQGIVEDESEVHIQLIERELHKLREELHECKMNQTSHYNTNDSQHDCSRLENLFTFQKFNKLTGSSDEDFLLWFEDFNAAIACSTLNEIDIKLTKLTNSNLFH